MGCPTAIEKPIVLLVEGTDEEIFCEYFFKYLVKENKKWENLSNIQVIPYDGTSKLELTLQTVLAITGSERIQKIGIIRDADDDADRAFAAVKTAIENSNLLAPIEQFTPTLSNPSISVMIIPENGNGSFETLCLNSVCDDPAVKCVEHYFSCLEEHYKDGRLPKPTNIFKAKVHAFLSSRKFPSVSVGGGTQKDYWILGHAAFKQLKRFLDCISSEDHQQSPST
ncbi:DUF3226 domain-containing protein [Methanoculleus sp.]|uniref:DUF3226 domain-containing protein n=1 Tax=Methanoculleus sp. TaxID=90427 RepID=UPI001BD465F8|nr:DUF3226 domain-containing protein [Methanoculleus sp.]